MIVTLLCSVTRMAAGIVLTEEDGLLATISTDEAGTEQYEYTSPVLTLEEASNTLYFTFLKGKSNRADAGIDKSGYPFVAFSEFYLYDGDGNKIVLDASNFSTNAQETSEGAIENICDDDRSTFWHSTWSDGANDYHYLLITLPEGQKVSDFRFGYFTRYTLQCLPAVIHVSSTHEDIFLSFSGTCGENLTWSLADGELTIDGIGAMEDWASVNETPWHGHRINSVTINEGVTSIGGYAFWYRHSLKTVTIPESITKIGRYAFEGCSSLISINIPEGVTEIGYNAFYGCAGELTVNCNIPWMADILAPFWHNKFKKITVTDKVASIDIGAFADSDSLVSLSLNCTHVKAWFSGITTLQDVVLGENVKSIGSSAFEDCINLSSVTIPESVISIGGHAFANTPWYYSWYSGQPDGVVYINQVLYTYKGTMPENATVDVKVGTTSIASNAFSGCSGLSSITIPEGVTEIGEMAFSGCSNLTSITIPESVTEIGGYAFEYCSSLTSINIPEGVTEIGAFSGCTSLASITIPESVTSIRMFAFEDCSSLTSINIPENVTGIGQYAFSGCSSLTSISIPKSVTKIGNNAFDGCTSLREVIIKDGNEVLSLEESYLSNEQGLFYDCPLESVYWGRDLDYSYSPFRYLRTLISVTVGDKVTSIGEGFFYGCSGLSSITILEGVTEIGQAAFYDCSNLTSITIPKSVTEIGGNAFDDCISLKEIVFEDGGDTLNLGYNKRGNIRIGGEGLFYDCPLEKVHVGRNLSYEASRSYGYSPFYGKTTLDSLTVGTDVTEIGDYAFSGCTGITSIISCATTPPACASTSFVGVDTSIPVTVPEGSVADYQTAEVWKDFTNFVGADLSGIDTVDNSQFIIHNSQFIYDLSGRRVTHPTKGIYIVNGRKVVIR